MRYLLGSVIASCFWIMALNPAGWKDTSPMAFLIVFFLIVAFIYEYIPHE